MRVKQWGSRSAVSSEKIKVLDYHDGTLAFSTDIGAFSSKQACIDQGKIVDNKRAQDNTQLIRRARKGVQKATKQKFAQT
ncbi:Uncharacterised protein [Raoultella planticola]|uniref:Uncharacterized protein n=1 Tax=Raoultella planticola TaxID=575 RepID=A0A485ARI8_RAOPL|nr:Uncharacterised protein [Raoultella planticola]